MITKLKAVETTEEQPEAPPEFSEELPPLRVDPTSFDARTAGVEPCSVVREISKHWGAVSAYEVEREMERGELKSPEEAKTYQERWEAEQALGERERELWLRKWEPRPDEELEEHIKYIKRKAARFVDWGDIGKLWNSSPRDAIDLWREVRLEARDEFLSGHYGARAFEVMRWQHEVWMTQAYVTQIEWTERAMTRLQGEPRTESYEFRQWAEQRKLEAKFNHWNPGHWDVPYQEEAEAVEQAFRMVELCAKSFQRAARQLANIRLVRAKTARVRRRERAKSIRGVKVA